MKLNVGDIVLAKVTGINDYGFFVKVGDDYTGLCHISQISNDYVEDIHNIVSVDSNVYVEIIEINEEQKHLKISIKDIYYRASDDDMHIVETRKGFLPLKQMLPVWIEEKMKEYK